MALTYRQTGSNPDGSPHFTVESDTPNPNFLVTGAQAFGVVRLPDGTSYDVTPPIIETQSHEHAGLVAHLIAEQHEQTGRHGLTAENLHQCNKNCGSLRRKG